MLKKDAERVDTKTQEERMSICNTCPSLKLGFCTECGCKMSWKTTLKNAHCPIHKWSIA
jgi:hypothetical protein